VRPAARCSPRFASRLPLLIAGRAIKGFSVACCRCASASCREHLPAPRVPVAIGWLAAMASFSAGAGIVLGGWVVDASAGARSSGSRPAMRDRARSASRLVLPASTGRQRTRQLDVLGGVLLAPAVAALLWAITRLKGSGLHDR
jgi:MFS family permease